MIPISLLSRPCAQTLISSTKSIRFHRSSPLTQKYSASRLPQISGIIPPSHPLHEGRIAIVTDVGVGCGGRGSVGRAIVVAGRLSVSDRKRADDRCCCRIRLSFVEVHCPRSLLAKTVRVRQNRVVLAPVAGVKLAEAASTQPSLRSLNPPATVTRRIRRRGERGISRKAIAQGMSKCSVCPCMLVCVFCALFAHETAGAACTRHSLLPLLRGTRFRQTSGASRREIANAYSVVITRDSG